MASTIILRPYQTDAINQMRTLMQQGCKSILYQGATGSGKTALTAHMLHTAASKGMRSFFIVHRRELIKQSTNAFALEGLRHGIISAGFFEDRRHLVQLAGVQTLARRLSRLAPPALIVWDECHHLAAGSWSSIFSSFPKAYHIGLTATPERLDGQGLSTYFKEMIHGPSVQQLIKDGYLSPYKLYAPSRVDTSRLHTRMGDYEKTELAGLMDRPTITGDAVSHYKRLAAGKRAIVFAVSIQHSKHIVEKFRAEGINAEHVDGESPSDERDTAIKRFREGNIQILSNVDLFGEGFDVPSVEAIILLRPTQSLGLYLQTVGRGLRVFQGKLGCIILDHVGNCERHGLPDEERNWSLDGRENKKRGEKVASTSVKICPKCFAAQTAGTPSCRFCGFVYEVSPRKIEEKEGELSEVDIENRRRLSKIQQGSAESLEELTALGVKRGYKFPRRWAYYVFKSRQAKKLMIA